MNGNAVDAERREVTRSLWPVLVRAYIEPEADNDRPAQKPTPPARRALLVHVQADERERCAVVVVLELLDGHVIGEWLAVPDEMDEGEVGHLRNTLEARPSMPAGIGAEPVVLTHSQLGPLLVRRGHCQGVPLVAWDMAWTLGRLAAHVGRSAGEGFSVALVGCGAVNAEGQWKDSDYYPRLRLRSRGAGSVGAFVSWGVPRDKASRLRRGQRPGAFVDLSVHCASVCGGEVEAPAHAADLLGVEWPDPVSDGVDQLRVNVGALVNIYKTACAALEEAAPSLHPWQAWSAGSIVRHSLRTAGVRPLSEKVAALGVEVKAAGAGAFHGGRCEAQLVGVALPMAVADISSTYPSIWSALDLTAFLSCNHVEVQDVTEELAAFLASPDLADQLYRREVWRRWGATFAAVRPAGEHLPAQVKWRADRVGGTVAPLDLADGTLPVTWCDLAAAALEGGPASEVVSAFRLVPVGVQPDLRRLRLPTGVFVDLAREDLGEALVRERMSIRNDTTLADHEQRRMLGLSKLYANALTFGLLARHDRKSLASAVDHVGHGPDGAVLTVSTTHPEVPGPDAFLPLAAIVTAGCRLAVAMARRPVLDAGGSVAHIATDAVAVAASPDGGLFACPGGQHRLDDGTEAVRLLSFDELRETLARFDRCSPRGAVLPGPRWTARSRHRPSGSWWA